MGIYYWTPEEKKYVATTRRDQQEQRLYGVRPPKGLSILKRRLWQPLQEAHGHIYPAFLSTAAGATGGQSEATSGVLHGGGAIYPSATQPQAGWPDAFMSYSLQSGGIAYDGLDGATISYMSFEDVYRSDSVGRPILLTNSNDVLIERIDTRKCTMGLMYAQSNTNITIQYCRAENIGYEFYNQAFPGNDNDLNVIQVNGIDNYWAYDIKAKFAQNEDAFSYYDASNSGGQRLEFEGCIDGNETTSDASPSTFWTSASGTAVILGDSPGTGGHDLTISDSSFIDPGQVGLAIACGYNNVFDNCVCISTGDPAIGGPQNVGGYISAQAQGCSTCTNNEIINSRTWFENLNHIWIDTGSCSGSVTTGSTFGDATLDVEDYRVTL